MTNEKLIEIRKGLNLSQWGLAVKLGVSQASISTFEKGYRPIPDDLCLEVERIEKELKE